MKGVDILNIEEISAVPEWIDITIIIAVIVFIISIIIFIASITLLIKITGGFTLIPLKLYNYYAFVYRSTLPTISVLLSDKF